MASLKMIPVRLFDFISWILGLSDIVMENYSEKSLSLMFKMSIQI